MIPVKTDVSLKPYNSFGIDVNAKQFAVFNNTAELLELLELPEKNLLVLGGGSNILLTKNFDGLVLKNNIGGKELVKEDERNYYVKAGAGENWHEMVLYCLQHNYAGLENLSLIPGNVGASPMQNIGAYGVEIKDVFEALEAYDLQEKKIVTFGLYDCNFNYRESAFKNIYKGRFIILNVTYKLLKQPLLNISYGAIQQELDKMNLNTLTIQDVSQAVINIRQSKLPNPSVIGNAGSFFKNPTIDNYFFNELKSIYPNIPGYFYNSNQTKIAAGWLIEQCGWKGYRKNDAGCYDKQALVLVNYGSATGNEIEQLADKIVASVKSKFDIHLEKEVNVC